MRLAPTERLSVEIEVWIGQAIGVGVLGTTFSSEDLRQLAEDWPPLLVGQVDEGWDMVATLRLHPHGEVYCHVGLWVAGRLEGVLVLQRVEEFRSAGRPEVDRAPRMLYVQASPHSRRGGGTDDGGKVRFVGPLLILVAIALSELAGCGGRLSWHSEKGSEEWYRHSIPNVERYEGDFDGDRHLTLYEMDEGVAAAFKASCAARGVSLPQGVSF